MAKVLSEKNENSDVVLKKAEEVFGLSQGSLEGLIRGHIENRVKELVPGLDLSEASVGRRVESARAVLENPAGLSKENYFRILYLIALVRAAAIVDAGSTGLEMTQE